MNSATKGTSAETGSAFRPTVWRSSHTTTKRGIGRNPDWGEPNTAWVGSQPIDPLSVEDRVGDLWKGVLSQGTKTGVVKEEL